MNALQAIVGGIAVEKLRYQWVAIGGDDPFHSSLSRNHAWQAESAAEFERCGRRVANVQKLLNVLAKAHS